MREESNILASGGSLSRITPAHAGRIRVINSCDCPVEDHPRACGKNQVQQVVEERYGGSPPRMREELVELDDTYDKIRITPAHAGRILKNSINIAILYQLLP